MPEKQEPELMYKLFVNELECLGSKGEIRKNRQLVRNKPHRGFKKRHEKPLDN